MLTAEQKAERLGYITGSDAGVITGYNPYKTPLQLWKEKTGRELEPDISHKNHIQFGTYMEGGVARWFEAATGLKTAEPEGTFYSTEHDFLSGNVDRVIVGENAILECKTARDDSGWGNGENIFPAHYLMQVAHYCMVGGFDKAYIAVVFALTREIRWYTYERNEVLESRLFAREKAFWECVQNDTPPEPVTVEDVEDLFKDTIAEPLIANIQLSEAVEEMGSIQAQISMLEKRKKELKLDICKAMEAHEFLVGLEGEKLASWKHQKRRDILAKDLEKLKEELPDVYEKYVTEKEIRTFRLSAKKKRE